MEQTLYRAGLHLSYLASRLFGTRAFGIGQLADRMRRPFDFHFKDAPFRFVPEAARSYCLLPAGIPNEPETHQFLARLLSMVRDVVFIDVGASIGEFAVTMAHQPQVRKVYAFEPHPVSCAALRESIRLGPWGKVEIFQKGVSSAPGFASFDFSERAPTAAGLRAGAGQVELCTLDETLKITPGQPVVMLMDIEGGELEAMKGAQGLIREHRPLIVFEYNATTRKNFDLQQAADLLGDEYRLFRMRSTDGLLDLDLTHTWNVVALPIKGAFTQMHNLRRLFA